MGFVTANGKANGRVLFCILFVKLTAFLLFKRNVRGTLKGRIHIKTYLIDKQNGLLSDYKFILAFSQKQISEPLKPCLKTKTNLNFIYGFYSYRAVNTFLFGSKEAVNAV
jgi:hypothetical protein